MGYGGRKAEKRGLIGRAGFIRTFSFGEDPLFVPFRVKSWLPIQAKDAAGPPTPRRDDLHRRTGCRPSMEIVTARLGMVVDRGGRRRSQGVGMPWNGMAGRWNRDERLGYLQEGLAAGLVDSCEGITNPHGGQTSPRELDNRGRHGEGKVQEGWVCRAGG